MKNRYTFRNVKSLLILMISMFIGGSLSAQGYIFTNSNTSYYQNFNNMLSTGTTFPSGWSAARYAGTGTFGQSLSLAVLSASSNSGGVYNAGSTVYVGTDTSDRCFGSIGSGTTSPVYGTFFINNTGATIIKVNFSGVNEQWKTGSNSTVNEVDTFSYKIGGSNLYTGSWTNLLGMNLFEIKTTTTIAAIIDGDSAVNQAQIADSILNLNWLNGDTLWIRWFDPDNTGTDAVCAIDSLTVSIVAGTPTVATPTFTPAAGTYTSAQNVTINCTTSGASIYYTLDGTTPTNASTLYSTPIAVSTTKTIKARGYKTGMDSSAVGSALYTMNIPTQVATPTFSPVAGTYTTAQNVTISSTTTGATFRYTLDGTDPTSASTLYSGPIAISSTKTLKARGYFTGLDSSAVASGLYTMNIPTQVATPTFSPVAGTFTSIQNVTISCATVGAAIRYTLDGTDPVSTSLLYSTPLSIGTTTTLKARGFLTGLDSSLVASGLYTINIVNVVATPTLSPVGGNFINQPTVTISCTTTGASIYYTLDGTNPTSASTLYSTPITITQTKTLKTRGFKTAYDSSALVTGVYTLKVDTVHSSVAAGNYFVTQNVALTSASIGANIHYTLDGTTPTSASALYSAAIPISISSTLKARAFASGWDSSIVSSWAYTITAPPVSLPFVDTFNLTIGSLLTANGYTAHSAGGTNPIKVTSPALSYNNYPKSNKGNAITIEALSGEDVNKSFVAKTSGNVYSSFLLKATSATASGDYFFHLGPDTLNSIFRGRLFIKKDTISGGIAFGISKSTTTINYTAFNYALNTTYLVVVRYAIMPGATNDSIDLWVNPTMANMPVPLVSSLDNGSGDPINIGAFAFRQGSAANMPGVRLSGLMIDTSWTNMFAGVPPQVVTPTFTPASGTYTSAQSVTISTTTSGASIYYTTDGTDPTMASTLYTTPINVNTSMALKAKAYKTGYDSSFVAIAGYVINITVIPTVSTQAVTTIGIHGATLNGNLVADGGGVVTEKGFCYSTTTNPNTANTKIVVAGNTLGAYTANAINLTANTMYYVNSYAINSAGTAYGTQVSFTTLVDGIDELGTNLISLFPNPAKNSVTIKNAENYTIHVYSIVGQVVKQTTAKTNNYSMDISELPSGIYIMSFQYGDKKFTYRLTKQ